ncbi:cAMP-regulated phosphoprotein 21-like isoform X3 [Cimex lectularius]|uniref:Uncharacterized protein n=1 Tax=Cimex lectularius TaxID=79782 RepID=A0A8I6RGX4_CIMLE|nr:cAMP-regulated phosphoprotein 21-like isoform X3 [Cimex lectularius]
MSPRIKTGRKRSYTKVWKKRSPEASHVSEGYHTSPSQQPSYQVPSIVVQNGTKGMERTLRTQRSLSKQDEGDEAHEVATYEDNKNLETKESTPSEEVSPPSNTLHRSRSQNKVKLLVRSHAVREETSPPPDPHQNTTEPGAVASPTKEQLPPIPNQVQQQSTTNRRHKLRREGSSSETWDHPPLSRAMLECELIQNPRSDEKDPLNETVSTACYSQPLINEYETEGNSREQYEGSSQVDLHKFIVDTLNRNYKDRMLLLKIESDLVALAKDPKRTMHKFAQMSSYQRMLVHRVAAYFNMEHNVDTSGVSVIVNTTKSTRIPETRFRDYVRDDLLLPEEPRRSILKRDSSSFEETGSFKSGERMLNGDSRRSKSFEEREEEYEKARRRIFNREHSGDGEIDCYGEQGDEDEDPWGFEVGFCCNSQCEHSKHKERNPPRLLKVESYESGDTLRENSLRLSVAKSHSFNGYDPPQQTRILTKQDSGSSMSSRISPSSSGYKSQRSDTTLSATPSPTATPNLHTQTGQPYTNADGSIYHYDPANPPRVSGDVAQSTIGQGANGVAPSQATAPLHKHESLDNNTIVNANVSSQHPPTQQQSNPDVGKTIVESGYNGGGNGGYLAPPSLCQPPPPQFHQSMLQSNEVPPPQYHPVVYPLQPTPAPPMHYQQYDPRLQEGNPNGNNELSGYMMGLSLDGNKQPADNRQIMYWQPHHLQPHSNVPMYYNSGPGNNRYQGPPPSSQLCSTPQAYMAPPPPPPPATAPQPLPHLPPEHAGCYGPPYSSSNPECVPYTPSTIHMYYTPSYSSSGMTNNGQTNSGGTTGNGPGYFSTNLANCPAPIVALQYQQPCAHPTPPHTPQGVCGQFAVYNGCYSNHYAQPNSTLPVPQLFRKPSLQVGVRCGSPMRPPYPVSPTVKEKSQDDKLQPVPVYGFRVLPGDVRLLGNTGRLPFSLPANSKAPGSRKHSFVLKCTHSTMDNFLVQFVKKSNCQNKTSLSMTTNI